MDIVKLKNEIDDFDIPKKSITLFWDTLQKYRDENFDEYHKYFKNDDTDKFYIQISSISLELGNWPDCNYNHLVSRIPIWYDNIHIGDYLVMFTLDGKIDDDMLNIF
ncbi:MAG: hypothetical protein LBV08_01835 [Clostridiales bacterium]|jgi:hypothetical protein|nr:hypothetical protein [Clostridiales bacterium]